MPRRSKLTDEERIAAVQEYLEGKGSYAAIAKRYGINHERFRQMVIRAKTEGIEAVRISSRNKKYSTEIKLKAVTEYLEGKCSQMEICAKYHITQDTVFRRWISCYNSGKDFKERTRSERGITMNKGRKTTQEERAEIVAFCIENGKDYGIAMEKYGISYQQMTARKRHTVRQFTNGAKREISLFRHRKVSTATSFYLTGTVMV